MTFTVRRLYFQKKFNIMKYTVLLLLVVIEYCSTLGDNYVKTMFNTRLSKEYTYAVLERWSIAYCLIECSNRKSQCSSVNYNQAQQICELNGPVELSMLLLESGVRNGKLKSEPGWIFYLKDEDVRYFFHFN